MRIIIEPFYGEAFKLFSAPHLVALLLVIALGAVIYIYRGKLKVESVNRRLRWGIVLCLLLMEISLQGWYIYYGIWSLQKSLPLHLCGLSLLLSCVMLVNRSYKLYEVVYFWGLGGATQALLTPDTAYNFPHLVFFIFFISHGLIVVACLWMTFVEGFRPQFKSVGKTFIVTNLYLVFIAILNLVLQSNYLYICHKPPGLSVLDCLGPWPWYLLALEALGAAIFLICYLPFYASDIWRKRSRYKEFPKEQAL